MKVLVIAMNSPVPPDRGDRLRAWDVLETLSAYAEVHLLMLTNERLTAEGELLLNERGICLHQACPRRTEIVQALARSIMLGRPWGLLEMPRLQDIAEKLGSDWDAVVGLQLKSAYYAYCLPARIRILDLTDSLALYRQDLGLTRNILRWMSLTGVAQAEAFWAGKFDVGLVCTDRDASVIRTHNPRAALQVVENGTRPWQEPVTESDKTTVLFVGDLKYPPNRDGVKFLVNDIWPSIHSALPHLRLRVVGRGGKEISRMLRAQGVDWVGYVDDLKQEFRSAIALLNTVRYGSGSRRKVLDAWSAGVPVVSTKKGAAGLDYIPGKHLLEAETPSEFVQTLLHLADHPQVWRELSLAGWDKAQQCEVSRIWDPVWRRLIGSQR